MLVLRKTFNFDLEVIHELARFIMSSYNTWLNSVLCNKREMVAFRSNKKLKQIGASQQPLYASCNIILCITRRNKLNFSKCAKIIISSTLNSLVSLNPLFALRKRKMYVGQKLQFQL